MDDYLGFHYRIPYDAGSIRAACVRVTYDYVPRIIIDYGTGELAGFIVNDNGEGQWHQMPGYELVTKEQLNAHR